MVLPDPLAPAGEPALGGLRVAEISVLDRSPVHDHFTIDELDRVPWPREHARDEGLAVTPLDHDDVSDVGAPEARRKEAGSAREARRHEVPLELPR